MATTKSFDEFKQQVETEVERLNAQVAELQGKLKQQEKPVKAAPKVEAPPRDCLQDFIDENGGRAALVWVDRNRWLLPTGAKLMNDGYFRQLSDPPKDEWGNNQARRAYAVAKLERVEGHFNQLKGDLTGASDGHGMRMRFEWPTKERGPMPPECASSRCPDGEVLLLRLKQIVKECRAALAAIDDEPIARKRREAEEANRQFAAKSQARAQSQLNRINNIEL